MLSILQWYPPSKDLKYVYKWCEICHHTGHKGKRRLRHRDCVHMTK